MSKAYDVMTQALATCPPDESAAQVARIMRDRDIGNVLVVDNGLLCGIVTDRDLALNALAGDGGDPHAPVSRFMSTKIITGSPDWSINKVARTMARHQIRRLPIVDDERLVGIISLGDIARRKVRSGVVTKLLKDVSLPEHEHDSIRSGRIGTWLSLSLAALSTSMIAWITWSHNGQQLRKQMMQSKPYNSATQAMNTARSKINEVASSKSARDLRKQVRTNIKGFTRQMPSIEFKPPKHRRVWIR